MKCAQAHLSRLADESAEIEIAITLAKVENLRKGVTSKKELIFIDDGAILLKNVRIFLERFRIKNNRYNFRSSHGQDHQTAAGG